MNSAYESIKKGLGEAMEHAEGKRTKAIVHEFTPVDVKNIRSHIGMSQSEFASAFGISVSTLRHWERGDRTPPWSRISFAQRGCERPQSSAKSARHAY
jgi:putative transcriptional regulator